VHARSLRCQRESPAPSPPGILDRRLVHEVVAISRDLAQIYVDLGWTEKLEKIVSETGTVIGAMHRTPEAEALLAQLGG